MIVMSLKLFQDALVASLCSKTVSIRYKETIQYRMMLLSITVTIMIIASKFILKKESTRDHIDLKTLAFDIICRHGL